jgi:hypothetical protein
MGDTWRVNKNAAAMFAPSSGTAQPALRRLDMRDFNADDADLKNYVQPEDSHPADVYSPQDEDAMYQLWLDRQRATADAAIAEAAELTTLTPIAATCRPVPAKMLSDFEGVFDVPVRSVAAMVADHVASL